MDGAGSALSNFYIRGFPNSNDVGLNGLYGLVGTGFATPFIERIEVLKGPSALLNGMPPGAGVGGSLNLVSKRAGPAPITQLTTSYVSRGQLGTHIDFARRFGGEDACGMRFNGLYENGDTAIQNNRIQLGQAALGLDCRTDRFRVSADLLYQSNKTDGITRFTIFNPNIPVLAPPDASKSYTPNWWKFDVTDKVGMINAEYDLTSNITAYGAIGGVDSTYPQVNGFPTVFDTAGNFNGSVRSGNYYTKAISGNAGLRANFDTGAINHLVNVNYAQTERTLGLGQVNGTGFVSNIYNPVNVPYQDLKPPEARKSGVLTLRSVGFADTMSILDNRVQFTAGVRRQQVESGNFNFNTGLQTSSYDSFAWTPAYALVVKPLHNVSLYANYIEGLQPGQVVGTNYANVGQIFAPYQTKQYEAGVKVDWGRITTTASAFQISQPATIEIPGNPPTLALDGENRNRGVELNAFGELRSDLRLLGGVMFIDGRQVATANGLNDGKKAVGVPDVQINLGGEWDTPFIPGFTVTGRYIYTDSQYTRPENTQSIRDWTRVDLGARYTFLGAWNKPIIVRLDVRNVFDTNYWASVNGGYVGLGAPRTYLLSSTFNF